MPTHLPWTKLLSIVIFPLETSHRKSNIGKRFMSTMYHLKKLGLLPMVLTRAKMKKTAESSVAQKRITNYPKHKYQSQKAATTLASKRSSGSKVDQFGFHFAGVFWTGYTQQGFKLRLAEVDFNADVRYVNPWEGAMETNVTR